MKFLDRIISDIPKVGIETYETSEIRYVVDVRVILNGLKDYEVEIPKEYVDMKDDYYNGVISYMEKLTGVNRSEFSGNNTYNWSGRIMHDLQYYTYEKGDDEYYVALAVHRGGDVRYNYTEFALLKFDSVYQWHELADELALECGGTRVVNGKEYVYDLSIFSEYISVWCSDTGEQYDIYAYDDDSFDEEVRKCLS